MRFDLEQYWYQPSLRLLTILLLPLSWLFAFCAALRRFFYRSGIIKTQRFNTPIIVVGNITVGGTGKTPFVIWLTQFLQSQGYRPGIVSRGVGGIEPKKPHWVLPNDSAQLVGDEALLLAQRTGCPLVVGVDRVAAVRHLLARSRCNIVISDDGLQHYRLERDIEIAIVDGARRFGNRRLLPAGPLREAISRLKTVDFVVVNGGNEQDDFTMLLEPTEIISLLNPHEKISSTDFPHKKIHAVAGIGNPERFFLFLQNAGFDIITHPFPDHFSYTQEDFAFHDALPIIMTEKDAVKCRLFADQRYWYLSVTAKINNQFETKFLEKLKSLEAHDEFESDFAKHTCGNHSSVKHKPSCS